jgi:pimeloyl-ACP methyl ester carboxylesterase
MRVLMLTAAVAISLASLQAASAKIEKFPPEMRVQRIQTDGATIYVRAGGKGPAVVMLHGFADTGDMWAPLAQALIKDHMVIVPDLRGMGYSSYPADGYDKKTQGVDIATVMDKLGVQKADLVTHDIGNMVGYALAAQYPDRITKWVIIDAPLPGIGPWDDILKSPLLWHFNFRGPDMDRLVKGRERIYLERTVGRSEVDRRSDAPALCENLCASRRDACRFRAVRDLQYEGCRRQQGVSGEGQTDHADSRARGREIVRYNAGAGDARSRLRCGGRHHCEFRPLGHGGAAGADGEADPRVSGEEVNHPIG